MQISFRQQSIHYPYRRNSHYFDIRAVYDAVRMPGKMYDGRPAVLLVGKVKYRRRIHTVWVYEDPEVPANNSWSIGKPPFAYFIPDEGEERLNQLCTKH